MYLRNRIPRKLLLSNLLILLWPMWRTFNTELRANVPLQNDINVRNPQILSKKKLILPCQLSQIIVGNVTET